MKTGWVGPLLTLLVGLAVTATAYLAGAVTLGLTAQPILFYGGVGMACGGMWALTGWAIGRWEARR